MERYYTTGMKVLIHIINSPTNRELLMVELGNVHASLLLMYNSGDLDPIEVNRKHVEKIHSIKTFLHHQ